METVTQSASARSDSGPRRVRKGAGDIDNLLPTRRSLISRLRNHEDDKSWREFFERYWKLIYSFAVKCGCTDEEAEDVVQETIIAFARKMPEYRYEPEVCSFKGWLLHITNWRIIDQLRRRRAARRIPSLSNSGRGGKHDLNLLPDERPSDLETLWEEEWRRSILDVALDRVKRQVRPDHYQVFHLSFTRELPIAKVAQILGINRAQAYLIKHRVAARVRKEVKTLEG
jgi:RNA polymerase sigma factor (sigma-70 family)